MNLEPDSRAETDRLFAALKEGGTVEYAPTEMPWVVIGAASSIATERVMFSLQPSQSDV